MAVLRADFCRAGVLKRDVVRGELCLSRLKGGLHVCLLPFGAGQRLPGLRELLFGGGERLALRLDPGTACRGFIKAPGFGGEIVLARGEFGLNAQEGFMGVLLLVAELFEFVGELPHCGGNFSVLRGDLLCLRLQLGEPFLLREDAVRNRRGGRIFEIDRGGQRPEGEPVAPPDGVTPNGPVVDEGACG